MIGRKSGAREQKRQSDEDSDRDRVIESEKESRRGAKGERYGNRSAGGGREGERGPIDVGAGQVAPLIAPQRVQLCGPPAITAHSARHLTPRHPSNP